MLLGLLNRQITEKEEIDMREKATLALINPLKNYIDERTRGQTYKI